MANYKPKTKAIIDRAAIMQSKPKYGIRESYLTICLIFILLSVFLIIIFFSLTAATVFLTVGGIAIAAYPAYYFVYLPVKEKKCGPIVFYLETDTVSSADISKEIRTEYVPSKRGGHYRDVTYYIYTVYFQSKRVFKFEYNNLAMPERDKYSKMKNTDSIPSHFSTIESLEENDICYLLKKNDDDKIIDIFAEKYYSLSPTDFRETDGKFYLNNI